MSGQITEINDKLKVSEAVYEQLQHHKNLTQNQILEIEKDLDSIQIYVTLGLIGFIFTINEKLFKLTNAQCNFLLYISITFLFIGFVFSIFRKYLSIYYHKKILQTIKIGEISQVSKSSKEYSGIIDTTNYFTWAFIIIGSVLEIIYVAHNTTLSRTNINIEIPSTLKDTTIQVDDKTIKINLTDK